jgi:hypothetical protein
MNKKKNTLEAIQTTTKMQIINIMKNDETIEVNTTISLPCNSEVTDELGNTWKLEGLYYEVCDAERTFNKLKLVGGRLENKEQYCVKNGATKMYANSAQCEFEVKHIADCCVQDKVIRYSYECYFDSFLRIIKTFRNV